MIMNGIKLFVLFLQALQVLCSAEDLRSLYDCGHTPFYAKAQIVGGNVIAPDEFPWMASLEYGNRGYGYCGGSVISSLFVLTAAHCVTGKQVDHYGGLTGVRLGNFTQEPYCDYGTSSCASCLRFGIAERKVHENYVMDSNYIPRNDIALIRVNRPIIFGHHMKRVCLPFNTPEPIVDTQLTVAGWGSTLSISELKDKRAVDVPLLDQSQCEHQDASILCAGVLSQTISAARTACDGDSGGPLMHDFNPRQMVIEGIVSYVQGRCVNNFFPTHYTRVRHYLSWIEANVCAWSDCTSVTERKFPTDCGYTPMYPKAQSDEHFVNPDEYSWIAKLLYKNPGSCAGSVINSRYVLTTAKCVARGGLTGVRLGAYDVNGHICDYGIDNCTHYQEFGIEKIIPHSQYMWTETRKLNNIALIRLDREIQFGPKMKPICLPFGSKTIPEPPVDSSFTVSGWVNRKEKQLTLKHDAPITLWELEKCKTVWNVDETHICTENECVGEAGTPLMDYQFARRRMVLEGVQSFHSPNCTNPRHPLVYTRVRIYHDWLDQNMEM